MDEVKSVAFRKVHLHIHTPESLCYSDPSVTSEQIVDTALSAGLDIIAVTDHNTAEGIDGIRQVAGEKDLIRGTGSLFIVAGAIEQAEHLI